jgi:membrane protein
VVWATLKRTVEEFFDDELTDSAAALTYYAVLAIFPALVALVSIVGLVVDPTELTRALTRLVRQLGPDSAADSFAGPIESITRHRGRAGAFLVLGTAGALWTASVWVGGVIRASNRIFEIEEGRPFWKRRPLQLAVTLFMVLLLALLLVALVLTGPIADDVGDAVGIGDTTVAIWHVAKWPGMFVVAMGMLAVIYYVAPNARIPRFRLVTPGSVLAVVLWLIASAGFALYVSNFGTYDKTYGTLGGVISFLVWLWITNIAVLLGQELNAEIERTRELRAGTPGAEEELQLPAREEPSPG